MRLRAWQHGSATSLLLAVLASLPACARGLTAEPIDASWGAGRDASTLPEVGGGSDSLSFLPDSPLFAADRAPRADLSPTVDAGVPFDTLRPDTLNPADSFIPPDMFLIPPPATFTFPASSDTNYEATAPWFWNAGDYVRGTRTLALPSTTSLAAQLPIANYLCCDHATFSIILNGTAVGTFDVTPATGSSVSFSAAFARISGPTYTLVYQETNTVASCCGSFQLGYDSGSVTLSY